MQELARQTAVALDIDDRAGSGPARRLAPAPVLVDTGYGQEARWRQGERLEHLFERQCERLRQAGGGDRLAVDAGGVALTYDQLDARANRLARHLLARGARPGDRIGLLFDGAVHAYVGMLATLKVYAAYVPLDVGFPPDRIAYIVQDAGARWVLSLSHLRDRLSDLDAAILCLDEAAPIVDALDGRRLTDRERGEPADDLCYVVYTSGSTGRPKGVAIHHASICNFVQVAAEVYGIEGRDRVYQGMTIAFDFSVEEIWVPWAVGATLVPKPGGASLLGGDLWDFLGTRRITALCCVPTLLATLDDDLPGLRFLLVSGEACPQELIVRWHRPGRRFLNVYGPTEATVTATWSVVDPLKPVTIGAPLPTYSVVILDPADPRTALPSGEIGEIGIAGIGLAAGYVNRDDLTDRAFVRDVIGIAHNPSGRIYRTGDLGRINEDGAIEYHGRIDMQVKIRGYRVELSEIESVLLRVPGIAQAVVDTFAPEPGVTELVAYYSRRPGGAGVRPERIYEELRQHLPGYMVPAYLEQLSFIPMLPSDKADRKALPPPRGARSLATQADHVPPATATESVLAELLARSLRLERVSVESHFFDELGANSLLMAQFCAKVRREAGLPSVAMKDVYLHPTVRGLAAVLGNAVPPPAATPMATAAAASTAQYVLCGALQAALILGFAYVGSLVLVAGFEWVAKGVGVLDIYGRSLAFVSAGFVGMCALSIIGKWALIGRWRETSIPVWSLSYVRFWLARGLVRASPLILFVGSPLYLLHLRALGARIGPGAVIFSSSVPVGTDLLAVGAGSVIRKDASFNGYRARAGRIEIGSVVLGQGVLVGEQTVLDIGTAMGDGSELGHASSLHAGQTVPDGERWHGTPARPSGVRPGRIEAAGCGTMRKVIYSALQLFRVLALQAGLGFAVFVLVVTRFPPLAQLLGPGHHSLSGWTYYGGALALSAALFFGGLLLALAVVFTVPRLLNLALKPGRIYPLYGVRFALQRVVGRLTNSMFLVHLFGDSAFIVHYLRCLGYSLRPIVQTGSNFGNDVRHDNPLLTAVGSGSIVSDGLSVINTDFSSSSFRLSRTAVGADCFLGNNIAYPPGGRTGDNCLLATKVMIPLDGEIRENVGLLGSPCFEIPRSVQRDSRFDFMSDADELGRRLAAKTKYNAATLGLFLLARWTHAFGISLLALIALDHYYWLSAWAIMKLVLGGLVFSVAYFALVERAVAGFKALSPQFCSMYDAYYWWHERYWKLAMPNLGIVDGTPLRGVFLRMVGVRVGRKLFDDGCYISERSLVTIGDHCTLNAGSVIQGHSQEDGIFKSDHIVLGDGCTLGVKAFVHYGVRIGDGAVLEADAFVMKGEEIAPHARWGGNPASEIRDLPSSTALADQRCGEDIQIEAAA